MRPKGRQGTVIEQLRALLGPEGVEAGLDELRHFAEDALRGRGSGDAAATPLPSPALQRPPRLRRS